MSDSTKWIVGIVIVLVIGGLAYWFWPSKDTSDTASEESMQEQTEAMEGEDSEDAMMEDKAMASNSQISVSSPKSGDLVTSPMKLTGEGVGKWFFEGSFPAKLVDANGRTIKEFPVTTSGDFMTQSNLPFDVSVTFDTPSTDTGTIVLMTGSPSPDESLDNTLEIPVRFK